MQWKTPNQKPSSFLKSFLKKDSEEHPNKQIESPRQGSKAGARWKLHAANPTKFVLDFFTRARTDEEEEGERA